MPERYFRAFSAPSKLPFLLPVPKPNSDMKCKSLYYSYIQCSRHSNVIHGHFWVIACIKRLSRPSPFTEHRLGTQHLNRTLEPIVGLPLKPDLNGYLPFYPYQFRLLGPREMKMKSEWKLHNLPEAITWKWNGRGAYCDYASPWLSSRKCNVHSGAISYWRGWAKPRKTQNVRTQGLLCSY